MSALDNYRDALRNAPARGAGATHAWLMSAANFAAVAGVDAGTAERDLLAAMPRRPTPSTEVRDTVARAYRDRGAAVRFGSVPCISKAEPKPRPAPKAATHFIRRGEGFAEVDIWEASPVRLDWGEEFWRDAVALLHALFLPGERVFCGDAYGRTVRTREEWCSRWEHGEPVPPLFCPNPLKAGGGMTASGKPSPRCDDAVAVYRHAVAEMDAMPLEQQISFWCGWGLDAVSAITFSGSKSLHVLLRVDAEDAEEWRREVKGGLFARRLIPLGCDGACVNPSRLSRLAGARRADKGGAVQKLLFVREALA